MAGKEMPSPATGNWWCWGARPGNSTRDFFQHREADSSRPAQGSGSPATAQPPPPPRPPPRVVAFPTRALPGAAAVGDPGASQGSWVGQSGKGRARSSARPPSPRLLAGTRVSRAGLLPDAESLSLPCGRPGTDGAAEKTREAAGRSAARAPSHPDPGPGPAGGSASRPSRSVMAKPRGRARPPGSARGADPAMA